MSTLAKNSYLTLFFLTLGTILALSEVSPIASAALFWLVAIRTLNSVAPKFPFPRLIHWLHAMSFEALAITGVAILRFFPMSQQTGGYGRPILLVHGYLNHGSVWRLTKKRLEALGVGPIYTVNLGHPFRSICKYAEKVKIKAEAIAKETKRTDLIIIGHSMGGLVSCLYATKLAPPHSVTDVITIASPFAGTPVARIALGANAREMEPNSALVKEITQAILENRAIRFHHIATKSDQLVIPGVSAVLPENPHFIYEDIGHASLLYSPRVTAKLHEWLLEAVL